MEKAGDLPAEKWLGFFREIGGLGIHKVSLSGGEVFLRKDLFELIDGVIENRMRYSILTNGTLINEKTIENFSKSKRKPRLDSIQISIDGSSADIHDRSRPPKSFDKAVAALRLLKENNFPVAVRVTINRHNVDDLENIAALLIDDVGLWASAQTRRITWEARDATAKTSSCRQGRENAQWPLLLQSMINTAAGSAHRPGLYPGQG
jgi:MoaA/NifB/PqqE/SkfB family radical SAM enzyme